MLELFNSNIPVCSKTGVYTVIHDKVAAFKYARAMVATNPKIRLYVSDRSCIISDRGPEHIPDRYEEKDFVNVNMKIIGKLYGEESKNQVLELA